MDFSLHKSLASLLNIELEGSNQQENTDLIVNQFKNCLAERNYLIDKNDRLKNIVSEEEIDIEQLIETVLSEDEVETEDEDYSVDEDEDDSVDEDEDEEEDEYEDDDNENEEKEIDTDEEIMTNQEDDKMSIESVSTNDGD